MKKRITTLLLLLTMLISMFPVITVEPEEVNAGMVYIEGLGNVELKYDGKNGYKIYLDEEKNLIVKGNYYHNSSATLSYHTSVLYFASRNSGKNPGGLAANECFPVGVEERHQTTITGSNSFVTYTVYRSELEDMITYLFGADGLKTEQKVYMSEGFRLTKRDSASDTTWDRYGDVYSSLSGIQGAAGWSDTTYENFANYYDIALTLELTKYNITVEAGEGGSVGQSHDAAYVGDDVTVNAYPDEGYNFTGWSVEEGTIPGFNGASAQSTFAMPSCDVVLKANFEKKDIPDPTQTPMPTPDTSDGQYTVTVTSEGNGIVSKSRETADAGDEVTINAYPDDGYAFNKWTVESGEISDLDTTLAEGVFTMPSSDVAIKASFKKVTPSPTPKPTYVPTIDTKEQKMYTRYFTTDAGYTVGGIYDGTVNYTDESFGWLATAVGDKSSTLSTDFPAGKGDCNYDVGTDASGNTWYFIVDGENATYVHPKIYNDYDVDSADVRAITELTFPSSITDEYGKSYTVTSIGGGTDKYNNPFSGRTDLSGDFGDSRDEGDEERYYGKPSYSFYKLVNSYPEYSGTSKINSSREKRIGVLGNGSVTSTASFTGYYSGVSDLRSFTNRYHVYNTTLKFVTIPDTVTSIEAFAFYNCQALVRVSGGEGVKEIGEYAFAASLGVTPIPSVKKTYNAETGIYSYSFYVYNGSYSYGAPTDTMQKLSEKVKISEYMSLPELPALWRIYSYAFYNRTNLKNVTLPSTLQYIYLYAFEGCMLDSITIPGKTTEILSSSAWGWTDPETRYLYETLGTKGSSAEPKTLIITSPHSPTMDYGLVHDAYYDMRAGYTITYHSNTTPADTYTSTTKMSAVQKMLMERVSVNIHTEDNSMGYLESQTINDYEIYLDTDAKLWLDKKDKQPVACMPERTFYNLYAFEIKSGSDDSYTAFRTCLAFASDGTVWGFDSDSVGWQNLGIPEGSTYVSMSVREGGGGGASGGERKSNLMIYYLSPEKQLYSKLIYEKNCTWSSSGWSYYNDSLRYDSSCTPVSIGMPTGIAALRCFSVEGYVSGSGDYILSMPPTIYARDTQGGIWKHSTGSGWVSVSSYQSYSTEYFDEDYTYVDLGPVVVEYKFYDTLYDCMFDPGGKTFAGWTLLPDGTGTVYQPGNELRVTGPTTVYAKWEGTTKKIIQYHPNGGMGVMQDDVYLADTPNPVTLSENKYTKKGCEFAGWSFVAEPKSGDKIYPEKGEITIGLGITTVYAQWEPVTYVVRVGTDDVRVEDQAFEEHILGLDDRVVLGTKEDKELNVFYDLNDKETQTSMQGKAEFVTELTNRNTKAFLAFYGWHLYEDVNKDDRITEVDRYVGYYEPNSSVKNLATKKDAVFYAFPYWGGSASYVQLPEIVCGGYVFVGYTPGTAYAPDSFKTPELYVGAIRDNVLIPAPIGSGALYQPKADGEVLYAYYEREMQEGEVYGFEVYDVFGSPAWEELQGSEQYYTIGIQEETQDIWDTLPLRNGVHPFYRNLGGLPKGGGFFFRVMSTGIYGGENVSLTITPHLCPVGEEGYYDGDIYFLQETNNGSYLKKWESTEQELVLYADKDSMVTEDGSVRIWTGTFRVPEQLWLAEANSEVIEYQKQFGLNFEESFWQKDVRLMLCFTLCFEDEDGECLYYGRVQENQGENIWLQETGEPYREDYDRNLYDLSGGEIAVIYPTEDADKWNCVYGIY